MTGTHPAKTGKHPSDNQFADYSAHMLSAAERERFEGHIASCEECLAKLVSIHESVGDFKKGGIFKKRKGHFMKKINFYLIFAIVSFVLSFITPKYFLQFLVATVVLGTKWVADSKSTRMLVMIYEAWKRGGEKEASQVLETLESRKGRLNAPYD